MLNVWIGEDFLWLTVMKEIIKERPVIQKTALREIKDKQQAEKYWQQIRKITTANFYCV